MSELFTENIWCPICGSNHRRRLYPIDEVYAERISGYSLAAESIGVVACGDCGHEYIYQVPSAKFLCSFYSNYMSTAKTGFYSDRALEDVPANFRARYQPWLSLIKKWVQPGARLLDIGAGLGMFLKLAREQGYEVSAVEPNEESTRVLEEHYGIPMQPVCSSRRLARIRYVSSPCGTCWNTSSILRVLCRRRIRCWQRAAFWPWNSGPLQPDALSRQGLVSPFLRLDTTAAVPGVWCSPSALFHGGGNPRPAEEAGFRNAGSPSWGTAICLLPLGVRRAPAPRLGLQRGAGDGVGTARLLGMQKNLIIFARKES